MHLSTTIQEALVAILCYETKSAAVACTLVKSSDFDPFHQAIAESAIKYRERFGEAPGEHTLDLVENLKARFPKNAHVYDRILESILECKQGLNVEYVLTQATVFAKYQRMRRGMTEAIDLMEKEDESSLVEAERVLRESLDFTSELFDVGTLLQDPKRSLRFLDRHNEDNDDHVFPTGIHAFDKQQLGPTRKRVHLMAGASGTGKSWWLINLAKQGLLAGKRVLYVTCELDEEEVAQRMYQALFSISTQQPSKDRDVVVRFEKDEHGRFLAMNRNRIIERPTFKDPKIRKLLRRLIDRRLSRRPPLYIKEFPMGTLTMAELGNYIDSLESTQGFIPDLLLLDYVEAMHIDTRNYRLDVGQLYRHIKGMAAKRSIAIATATHINKEGVKLGRGVATGENLAEDYSKDRSIDYLVTFNRTHAEEELGLARLFMGKARTGPSKFTVLISQAYEFGQFCMDEVGYLPSYWEQVDQDGNQRPNSSRRGQFLQRATYRTPPGDEASRATVTELHGLGETASADSEQAGNARARSNKDSRRHSKRAAADE